MGAGAREGHKRKMAKLAKGKQGQGDQPQQGQGKSALGKLSDKVTGKDKDKKKK